MIRGVLFDLGDTLFQLAELPEVTAEFAAVLAAHGWEDAADEASRIIESARERLAAAYGRGDHAEPRIAELAAPFIGVGAAAEALALELERLGGAADTGRWLQPVGREAVLDELRRRDFRLGFVSNTLTTPAQMRARLDEFGLLHYAQVAVFSVEQRVRKPHPEIYRAGLNGLGLQPEEIIFIGDRVREDVLGPQSLGMHGVLTHEFRQEDFASAAPLAVVTRLEQLLDLIA